MIRPYHPSDRPMLDEFFARNGNPWSYPDPEDRHTVQTFVLVEDGAVKAVICAVGVVEVHLAIDRADGSRPSARLARARALIEEGCRWLYEAGFGFAYTPVPRELAGWARKLRRIIGVDEDDRIQGVLDLRKRFEWSLSSASAAESKT